MKVLGLSAGTLNGANDSLCKEALMAAKDAGAEIEFLNSSAHSNCLSFSKALETIPDKVSPANVTDSPSLPCLCLTLLAIWMTPNSSPNQA